MEVAVRGAAAEDGVIDLLIRNALVFDGSGARAAAGRRRRRRRPHRRHRPRIGDAEARRASIDADGLALMPGIIDSHTHFDAQITWDPTLAPVAGARRDDRGDRQLRLHHRAVPAGRPRAHDAQPDAGRGHVARRAARRASPGSSRPSPSTWRSCARTGCAVNVAAYVGHSSRAHLRDGRRRGAARGHRRRDRADAGDRARGDGARRGRLRQQHLPGAQRRGRPADAVAPGRRRARWRRWSPRWAKAAAASSC